MTWALLPTGGRASGVAAVIYARARQRTTAATEAIHLSMGYAFDDLGHRRSEWKCDSLDAPSRRAVARWGFTYGKQRCG
ncbi:MAG: GNAT family N-acetyltransferase [Actinomycetota bacterium]|nr:GNAT family N-acetyltransferase [Actinomycetota bacterium]